MFQVICAWHPVYFPVEPVPILGEVADKPQGLAHGICEACALLALDQSQSADQPQRFTGYANSLGFTRKVHCISGYEH